MNPSSQSYTIAMPWYERTDFEELWALSADKDEVPRDYDRWHAEASRVMRDHLARGVAIQFIRIRPVEYLEWLADAPNTASMRRTYVEYLAAGVARQSEIIDAA
ncbi:hypothetical protein [Bosea sp. ANAM02]|uniref:hypothetical protein n=1 Tax=Bosea sp. ANAM02 TaxID=2020412 RepID=UPI00140EE9E4|nr:hypothetical protein [Bosea sp. ANAM02]BCB19235.1 hypothetical protein OCUBac02_21290 [Bosea sp. ANAM02]